MELKGRSDKDIANLVPQLPKLKCGICSSKLFLVTQCYVPIAGYDRFLYVFGCNNASCSEKSNAWTCLRTQFKVDEKRVEKQKNKPKDQVKLEVNTEQVTDWNQTVDDKELDNLLANQASSLQKVTKKETTKKKKKKVSLAVSEGNLPCFALDIYEEPEDEEFPEDSQEMKLLKELKNEEVNEGVEAEAFAKKFMSEKIQGINFKETEEGDKVEGEHSEETDDETHAETNQGVEIPESQKISLAFVHFQTILAKCPNQSIRWQYGGKPLWVSDAPTDLLSKYVQIKKKLMEEKAQRVALKDSEHSDDEDELDHEHDLEPNPSDYIPKCDKCGAPRVFELEILPTLIYQLQVDKYVKKGVEEGMQFGCVCIFTCSNPGCDGYSEQERKQLTPNVTPKLKYSKEYIFVQPGQ
ncbi:hypothetical protein NAEGRDRAFT_77668 [Naegleria gruberi]|uniref:Programmed cell death protein 2 C-terminal domain-containing protein n=1 Tax=Naegleria gruberi TaxID=5762 RepID=D2UXE9_NAEGR|nr:uncharacterized protein NAEGRDRAFT_77668 [Naegleria gruberi]EFC50620.1 hypothetical protein NAEGRDRAFT_77668 [Naegleria gruberi]|eukprot:XP_002683364.1 hypothetical protein NAEGRDRAFT_77668 [Naegleria gruberi strain NEG-M]